MEGALLQIKLPEGVGGLNDTGWGLLEVLRDLRSWWFRAWVFMDKNCSRVTLLPLQTKKVVPAAQVKNRSPPVSRMPYISQLVPGLCRLEKIGLPPGAPLLPNAWPSIKGHPSPWHNSTISHVNGSLLFIQLMYEIIPWFGFYLYFVFIYKVYCFCLCQS